MNRRLAWTAPVLLSWLVGIPECLWLAQAGQQCAIRRSDVVFMYDNPAMYEPYGCTVLGWAGRADRQWIQRAHDAGVRHFSSSVGFLTEFRRVIDFSDEFLDAACRDIAGEPFIVPWLWDHKYQERPAWWWCTNSPLYRRYLASRLEQVIAAGPDGLHIDDYRGTSGSVTWLSGCFCRHCMAAFRQYLSGNVPRENLTDLGITNLSAFDYRQWLLDRDVNPADYNRGRSGLPLADEFYDFQVKANCQFVAAYRKQAAELAGRPLTLCVNSGLSNPHALVIAPELSYFCCEVGHHAAGRQVPKHPIYIYKLADGLDRPVASTASGQDWAHVAEHRLTALVRTWIAMSYACGHTLMAPHRQWCYTKGKGTHWYSGPTEQYAYVYRFVRANARLLDGYQAVAPVAVVYDNAGRRQGFGDIEPITIALAERNIPFTVLIAGDDWLDYRLNAEELASFQAVIVAQRTAFDKSQQALVDGVQTGGRLIVWPDDERLDELVPNPVVVDGSELVGVVPRVKGHDPAAPVAVHLLNRHYDGQSDRMVPQRDFTLRLRHGLFGDRRFRRAVLHAPKEEPIDLEVESEDEHTAIHVPQLELWAVLELGP